LPRSVTGKTPRAEAGRSSYHYARGNETEPRTIGIEVGMQNSGLGVALPLKYFTGATAFASAIFSIRDKRSGALAAAYRSSCSDLSQDMSKKPPKA